MISHSVTLQNLILKISVIIFPLLLADGVQAQVSSDRSLSTQVTTKDNVNFTITEGDRAGNNLFHSFQEFSVPTNGSVIFDNSATIENIINRVTGDFSSNIDGWTPLYNGDGMIYKLSFNSGGATLKTRLAKAPCYYADQATADPDKADDYEGLAFQDLGISRISYEKLGVRNQVNTAFLPFKTPRDANERLLVTWDVGRPHEIDPETLETLQPVGLSEDWQDMLPTKNPLPFKQLMTSAHPCLDPTNNEVYTINVGKSLWTMFGLSRSIKARLKDNAKIIKQIESNLYASPVIVGILKLYEGLLWIIQLLIGIIGFFLNIYQKFAKNNFVHLMRWDGNKVAISQQWNILLPGNKPLKIDQTTHQMGLTEKYLVIAESSFKFSLENTLPYHRNSLANSFKTLLADFLDYPQFPYTKLYIIKRDDLANAIKQPKPWWSFLSWQKKQELPIVIAKEMEIRPEFSHYLVDYKNPNDRLILHASHLAASDIAECIRIFERSFFDNRDDDNEEDLYDDAKLSSRVQQLSGNVVGPMDASRLGCWIIDPEKAQVLASDKVCFSNKNPQFPLTWATAFYACRDEQGTENFTDIYWNSWGAWPDLLTSRTVKQYEDYPEDQREVKIADVVQRTYEGIPSSICHLKINANADTKEPQVKLEIVDQFEFKDNQRSQKNVLGTSAQFVPRPQPENPPADYNPQTDGYIVCVVLTSDEFFSDSHTDAHADPNWSQCSELWIFDAANLEQGPLYKLSHSQMNFGFTVHTTWLKETVSPEKMDYKIEKDYEELVQNLINNQTAQSGLREKIRKLFDEEVYPNFS